MSVGGLDNLLNLFDRLWPQDRRDLPLNWNRAPTIAFQACCIRECVLLTDYLAKLREGVFYQGRTLGWEIVQQDDPATPIEKAE